MISYIFKNAIEILKRKPFMLWGVSLLYGIIVFAVQITGSFVPILTIPIIATLDAGMLSLYLDGYNGKEVNSKQLFRGFSKDCIGRVPAGMLWHTLWTTIWAFVPIAGIVKAYSYMFTPYILLTNKDVSVLDALKLSMKQTQGYKGRMFGANLLMSVILCLVLLVFGLIMLIPIIGTLIGFVGIIATLILFPLFSGLVMAGFYQEATTERFEQPVYSYIPPQPSQQQWNEPPVNSPSGTWFCTQCGAQNGDVANFCTQCGNPRK